MLGLSQKVYINKVLEKFRMEKCSASPISIKKEDKFSLVQCLRSDLERKQMKTILYALVVVAFIMKAALLACIEDTT